MRSEFTDHQIVPQVISIFKPLCELEVSHDKPHSCKVEYGNILTPTLVQNQPSVIWEADPNQLYTIILLDPDAPKRSNPINAPWLHWLVINIPGNQTNKGQIIASYVSAGPPPKTGIHRYIYLVYQQSNRIESIEKFPTSNRANWGFESFVKQYHLGNPVTSNFYQAEFDSYVPTLYEKLSR